MTEQQHPITPPPELVREWYDASRGPRCEHELAAQAARWGYEQRLNAVCEWLHYNYPAVNCAALRSAMHPKPPSLAEQAKAKLYEAVMRGDYISTTTAMPILLTALERLQELEGNG